MNAVSITNVPNYIERFIKSCLIENNQVGYDMITRRWAIAFGFGINEYWLPTEITFFFPNNKTSYRRPAFYEAAENGAYLIKALPTDTSFSDIIARETNEMNECDISIEQNLKACRTPFIGVVKDENMRLSVLQAVQQKDEGVHAIVVSNDITDGLKGVDFNTPYIVDKLHAFRDQIKQQLLTKLGIMSANTDKKERVQVGEVNATVGQCVDYIYLWIDTFNNQMVNFGLPFRMEINGALEELYTDVEVDSNDY